jgi:predicted Zn-dependent protease
VTNAEARQRLSHAVGLREAGKPEEARPVLVSLAAEFPNDATVQYQAGWVHDYLGLELEAAPYYERALALGLPEPDLEGLVLSLGSTYRNVGRDDDAVRMLTRGVHDYPGNEAMRCFLALSQLSIGNASEALALAFDVILATSQSADVERYRRALTAYRDELRGQ